MKRGRKIRIVVTVISDLVTDQRVHKVCTSLHQHGYQILLIGAKRKDSHNLSIRNYTATRIALLFQRKFGFYAEFNIRLFVKLLFTPFDIVLGNDLDVMPATYLAAQIKRKPIVYDTHEYYLGMPELNGKPLIKKVWEKIEQWIFPHLSYIYTICQSFCEMYFKDYGKQLEFIQNVPSLNFQPSGQFEHIKKEVDNKIPTDKTLLLFQGAGINVERGVEELVLSMQFLNPVQFHLVIVGGGDIFESIERLVIEKNLTDRITIIPKVPFEVLKHITGKAAIGFTVDKPNNINHIYGLPNKIFDYLHAGVPVISSRLMELEKIITQYNVGAFIENHDPVHIAHCIQNVFQNPDELETWRKNTVYVKQNFNWEKEEIKLLQLFEKVCKDHGLSV